MISLLAVINVPIIEAFTNLVTTIALCILCIVFCKIIISAVIIIIVIITEQMASIKTLSIILAHRWRSFTDQSKLLLVRQFNKLEYYCVWLPLS